MTSSKNQDTLVATEDDRVVNNIYSADQLLNFLLRARPQVPQRTAAAQGLELKEHDEHDMDTNEPPIPNSFMRQLSCEVRSLSKQQQQQLKTQFIAFQLQQQQILNQQQLLLDGQQRIFTALGIPHSSSSSHLVVISLCISISHKHAYILDDSLCYVFA